MSVDDDAARDAVRDLSEARVVAGRAGSAARRPLWHRGFGDLSSKCALVIVTEDATDQVAYERIVGRPHGSVSRSLVVSR